MKIPGVVYGRGLMPLSVRSLILPTPAANAPIEGAGNARIC
jgi:hypothetical protein